MYGLQPVGLIQAPEIQQGNIEAIIGDYCQCLLMENDKVPAFLKKELLHSYSGNQLLTLIVSLSITHFKNAYFGGLSIDKVIAKELSRSF